MSLGHIFIGKKLILHGAKPTIQPLGLGTRVSPKKVCSVFPYVEVCVVLM